MPEPIPAEAVQAAALALAAYYAGEDGDPGLTAASFEREARAALEAAAPVLAAQARREVAEEIAAAIRERGQDQTLDCWCHDMYADLARQIGEARGE